MRKATYDEITEKICGLIESKGLLPWQVPFKNYGGGKNFRPLNFTTGKRYRGINTLLLHPMCSGYTCPLWGTFKQIKDASGSVVKGSRGTTIYFFKFLERVDEKTGKEKRIPMLMAHTVFNLRQTEGLEIEIKAFEEHNNLTPEEFEHTPADRAQAIVDGYWPSSKLQEIDKGIAYYSPSKDIVNMPPKPFFPTADRYYHTYFHELVHSTGHESRLNRKLGGFSLMRSDSYSKEELIAEMGACFLSTAAGIDPEFNNSAAYIEHWLKALRSDPKMLVSAASNAQKAADLILGCSETEETEEVSE